MRRKPVPLTKTTPPVLAGIVPRTRLFHLLDRARRHPIIWVTGPPGSGKTTLVGSYLAARRLRGLWYQVDAGDADLAAFFYAMGLAARRAAPRIRRPLPLFTPDYRYGLVAFTRGYFREAYRRLRFPFAVVLDNYQEVPEPSPFHTVISEGLCEVPAGGHVIVVSRADPPPAMARFRAGRAMAVIDWDALRLTGAETRRIARQKRGRLSAAELRDLARAAEGWAAGLTLLLEGAAAAARPRRSLGEQAPEAVFDYFASEVFAKQDARARAFLLATALLGKMTAGMAEALTGRADAGRVLADLYRRHYFVEKRLEAEPVYQYHPLFRAFLRSRQGGTFSPARLAALRRRAAGLLARHGEVEEAATLMREGGEWGALGRLILDQAPSLMAQGRHQTLEAWLRALPPAVLARDPWLQYWLGSCRLAPSPPDSRPHFERAFQLFRRQGAAAGTFLAWCGVVESILYGWGDYTALDPWIERLAALRREHPRFPSAEVEARVAFAMFGALMFRRPQQPEMGAWARRVWEQIQEGKLPVSQRLIAAAHLALYDFWMGDLARATSVLETFRRLAGAGGAEPLSLLSFKVSEAIEHSIAARTEECLRVVADGLGLARDAGVHLLDQQLSAQAVHGALSAGDLATGGRHLELMAAATDAARGLDVSHLQFLSAWHALLSGDLERALRHATAAATLATEMGTPFPEALIDLAQAQILSELGAHEEAARHLARPRRLARAMGSRMLEFMSLLAEAHLAFRRGDAGRGLPALRRAMALGRAQGYVNTPWWRSDVVAELCVKALEAGIEVEYVQDLIRRRRLVPAAPPLEVEPWPWPLRLYTLGAFRVLQEGAPAPASRKRREKPLTLLKAIVALGGREVPVEQLSDAVWPEAEGDAAHRALDVTLHRLRELLGRDDAVQLRGGRASLDPRLCWVDAWAFERLLERAEAARQAGAPSRAVALTEGALALYRGHFLEGEAGAAWATTLRERLRSRFLRALAGLGEHWEGAGEWARAAECYQRGLEVDDLAEELYRRLMGCYQRLGRRAEALATYERCRRALAATLGVAPSAATDALHQALRAR